MAGGFSSGFSSGFDVDLVWDDAIFLWHPGDSETPSFDIVTDVSADGAITEGSITTFDGHTGRIYDGAVGSRFAAPITNLKTTSWTMMCVGRLAGNSREARAFSYALSTDVDRWATIWFASTGAGPSSLNFRLNGASSQGANNWPSVDNADLTDDTDLHVYIMVYTRTDDDSGTLTAYVDSTTSIGSDTLSSTSACTVDRLSVGRLEDSSPTNSVNGEIYAAASWDRAVTADEIEEILADPYRYLVQDTGQTLSGALFSAPPTFPTGTISAGDQTLSGSLFSVTPTFPTGQVSQDQTLFGALFSAPPTFPTGSVSQGQTLDGSLFTAAPTFFTGVIADYNFGELTPYTVDHEDSGNHIWTGFAWRADIDEFVGAGAATQRLHIFGYDGVQSDSFLVGDTNDLNGVTWDGSTYWTSNSSVDEIYQWNTSGSLLDTLSTEVSDPAELAWDGTNLWVSSQLNEDTLYQVDPSDGTIITSIPSPVSGSGVFIRALEWIDSHLWVFGDQETGAGTDFRVWKVDPSDGSIVDSFDANVIGFPGGMTYDGTWLWIADTDDDLLYAFSIGGTSGVLFGQLFTRLPTFFTGQITGGIQGGFTSGWALGWGIPVSI
jgi:hypothetical protein